MSTYALQKMTRDRFRVMSLAPRRKCLRNVVQMKEAMAAFFGLCIKVGRGHRDACVVTWDLGMRDEGLEDIKSGTRGRQIQGRRGCGM